MPEKRDMRSAGWLIPFLVLALLGGAAEGARALDLSAPGRMIGKLLGKKAGPPDATRKPGSRQTIPARAGAESVEPGAPAAAEADSSVLEALDEILLSPEPYAYSDPVRRDPFVSLVGDDYLEEHPDDKTLLSDFAVRGILWGENDRFALVEDAQGASFILHEGDRLGRFSVTRIEPDAVLVYSTEYGVGRTERLLLKELKGNGNARDNR
jgi:hypothetical protein